jgi:dTDP-glucose 4,6-dehydratase
MERISEDFFGGPNTVDARSAHAEGKRISELMGAIHTKQTGQQVLVARCFAFLGPFLPLDTHFAVGNFINDCLNGRDIIIKGDGTTCRSYLYASDLVVWLLKILVSGKNLQAYNVGSEHSISIKDLAQNVLAVWNENPSLQKFRKTKIGYSILGVPSGLPPEKYIPNTQRARAELGLTEATVLQEAILKTFLFHLHECSTSDYARL